MLKIFLLCQFLLFFRTFNASSKMKQIFENKCFRKILETVFRVYT